MKHGKSERLITKVQLSEYLQLHPETVARKVRAGEIPAYFSGSRTMRFDLDEVRQAMKRMRPRGAIHKRSKGNSRQSGRASPESRQAADLEV